MPFKQKLFLFIGLVYGHLFKIFAKIIKFRHNVHKSNLHVIINFEEANCTPKAHQSFSKVYDKRKGHDKTYSIY